MSKYKFILFLLLFVSCSNKYDLGYIIKSYNIIHENFDCIEKALIGKTIISRGEGLSRYYSISINNECFTIFSYQNDLLEKKSEKPNCFNSIYNQNLIETINCFNQIKARSVKINDSNNISITINGNITFIKTERLPNYKVNSIGSNGWYWYSHDVYD